MRLLKSDCEKTRELSALIAVDDGDTAISPSERVFFQAHLDACGDCAAFYNDLRNDLSDIMLDLKNTPEPQLPEFFHAQLMEKFESLKPKAEKQSSFYKRTKKFYMGFSAAAATLVAALIVGVAVIRLSDGFIGVYNMGDNEIMPFNRMNGVAGETAENDIYIRNYSETTNERTDGRILETPNFDYAPQVAEAQNMPFPIIAAPPEEITVPTAGSFPPIAPGSGLGDVVSFNFDECYGVPLYECQTVEYNFIIATDDMSAAYIAIESLGNVVFTLVDYSFISIQLELPVYEFDTVYATLAYTGEITQAIPWHESLHILLRSR